MVHSFTCAGILPSQYIKMSTFMGMGHVGHGYMKKGRLLCTICFCVQCLVVIVYYGGGYCDIIGTMAEVCMNKAVMEVQALQNYTTDGEVTWKCTSNTLHW